MLRRPVPTSPPSDPTHAAPPRGDGRTARSRVGLEVALAFAGATAVAAILYRVPSLASWFHAIVAAMFLYLPVVLLRRRDLQDYGLRLAPVWRNLLLAGLCVALFFPPFLVGFAALQKIGCAAPGLRFLAAGPCRPGAGLFSHFALRLPAALLDWHPGRNLLVAELVVVALPEEMFFRGYVQSRLDEVWPARGSLLGARVGPAIVVASALFALCHLAVQGNPATLAVFFPGLAFGWLRARAGSILPGVVFHALCNLFIETLNQSFFG